MSVPMGQDHDARITLYADRAARGCDLWTGKPLPPLVVSDMERMVRLSRGCLIRKRAAAEMCAVSPAAAPEVAGSGTQEVLAASEEGIPEKAWKSSNPEIS